jgi:hypothetical protein
MLEDESDWMRQNDDQRSVLGQQRANVKRLGMVCSLESAKNSAVSNATL